MLVIDVNTLRAIHFLDFLHQILLNLQHSLYCEDIMGIHWAFCNAVASLHFGAILHPAASAVRNDVRYFPIGSVDNRFLHALGLHNAHGTINLTDDGLTLRLAGLEEFFHPGQTSGDIVAGNSTCMEGSHGELRTRFANGLGSDNSNRFSRIHQAAVSQVPSITLDADAVTGFCRPDGANLHFFDTSVFNALASSSLIISLAATKTSPVSGCTYIFSSYPPSEALPERRNNSFLSPVNSLMALTCNSFGGAAVMLPHDNILRNVHQPSGEVTESAVRIAVSAKPLRVPWLEMKYSRTVRPSRKLALMGISKVRPVGSATRPRMPANWLICDSLP